MATPFAALASGVETATGRPWSYRITFSDVANAFGTFDDLPGTPGVLTVPATGYTLTDLSAAAAATVTAVTITKGTQVLPVVLPFAVLLRTLSGMDGKSRLGPLYGIKLEPGQQYGFKQLA